MTDSDLRKAIIDCLGVIETGSKGRNLWIYGAGWTGEKLFSSLCNEGYQITGFIDRNFGQMGKKYGFPVISIDDKRLVPKTDFIIISSIINENIFSMVNACIENNFSENDICVVGKLQFEWECEDVIIDGCTIGRFSYGAFQLTHFYTYCRMIESIGRFCSINYSSRVQPNHDMNMVTTSPVLWTLDCRNTTHGVAYYLERMNPNPKDRKIVIGNDVWIGTNVIILPGVHIGDGAVVGANAVVSHDVKPYEVVAGVPARHIRYRFSEDVIKALEEIKWWTWDIKLIKDRAEDFYDIDKFVNKYAKGKKG